VMFGLQSGSGIFNFWIKGMALNPLRVLGLWTCGMSCLMIVCVIRDSRVINTGSELIILIWRLCFTARSPERGLQFS
jgi:hypothetical protein